MTHRNSIAPWERLQATPTAVSPVRHLIIAVIQEADCQTGNQCFTPLSFLEVYLKSGWIQGYQDVYTVSNRCEWGTLGSSNEI